MLKAAWNGDVIEQTLNLWCLIRAGLVWSRTSIGYGKHAWQLGGGSNASRAGQSKILKLQAVQASRLNACKSW